MDGQKGQELLLACESEDIIRINNDSFLLFWVPILTLPSKALAFNEMLQVGSLKASAI
jgi:hypothetical protein